jgi:TorA maturation chaperone TorD
MISSSPTDPARSGRYESFARLFLQEPDAASLAAWQQEPRFAPAFPAALQALRVEFTRLFSLSVFPYASVFMDSDAFMNTETTARVEAAYQQAHFEPDPSLPIGAPDHFGLELAFVSHLLKSGRAAQAQEFLWSEVLPWACIFLHAVEKNAHEPFYRLAAHETLGWLGQDDARGELQSIQQIAPSPVTVGEDDLEGVVSGLLVPANAGIFLSKEEISSLAHQMELPLGFGDRAIMLKSLFRGAGEYGRIGDLLRLLQVEVDEWCKFYAQEAQLYPADAAIAHHWLKFAAATLGRLKSMEQMANSEIQADTTFRP